jgi:hypothetical protein
MIKSSVGWPMHEVCEKLVYTSGQKIWKKKRDHLEVLGVEGELIIKQVLKKLCEKCGYYAFRWLPDVTPPQPSLLSLATIIQVSLLTSYNNSKASLVTTGLRYQMMWPHVVTFYPCQKSWVPKLTSHNSTRKWNNLWPAYKTAIHTLVEIL